MHKQAKKLRRVQLLSLNEATSQTYGISVAIWDHKVLPATRHKWTVNTPRLNPSQRPVFDLPTPYGWKAELT